MPEVHVVPDERKAIWRVTDAAHEQPRSEYSTATEAEDAARRHAEHERAERIIIHDRYARTRELIRRGYAWLQARS